MKNARSIGLPVAPAACLLFLLTVTAFGQLDSIERGRAKDMLTNVAKDVKKYYYDENLRGIDLDAKVKAAKERIDSAKSLGEAFGIIAQVFLDFDDSHTVFFPPARAVKFEYGWKIQMIGDKCFVVAVKPGSDADKKGLRTGDQVLTLNGFKPSRNDLWKMMYYYYSLSPQASMALTVLTPSGEQKQIATETNIKKLSRFLNLTNTTDWAEYYRSITDEDESREHRFFKMGDVTMWRMPTFSFDPNDVRMLFNSHVKGKNTLILDLRGNGGGYVDTLKELVGFLFEKDMKIAEVRDRKKTEEVLAKSKGGDVFKGRLVVLIDSGSGSASEMFARLIQIEERGVVIGDRSAGAVMQSRTHINTSGVNTQIAYGANITEADVISPDGKSLEKVGVTPDEIVLPESSDLGYEKDPVLARAAEISGLKLTPEEAGAVFPIFWQDNKKGNVTYRSDQVIKNN